MAITSPLMRALALALICSSGLLGSVKASTSLDLSGVTPHRNSPPPKTQEPEAVPVESTAVTASAAPLSSVAKEESSTYEGSLVRERPRYRDPFGNRINAPLEAQRQPSAEAVTAAASPSSHQANFPQTDLATSRVAVVFFSASELARHHNVDELTGASVIALNDLTSGNTEYVAQIIASKTQGALFKLEPSTPYPQEHDALIVAAAHDLDTKALPEITLTPSFEVRSYDVIFVGYPIWWNELPRPFYTFFARYDLSGKIVIPFCTYGSRHLGTTFEHIAKAEPNAYVLAKDGLRLEREIIPSYGEEAVGRWLDALKLRLNHESVEPVGRALDHHNSSLRLNIRPQTAPSPVAQ